MKSKIIILILLPLSLLAENINLSTAYELSLSNDDEVKSSMYESLAATKRKQQATSAMFPSIQAEVSYYGNKYNKDINGYGDPRYNESYTKYGISLSQPLFRPELWYQRSEESLREDINLLSYESTKQELARKVAQAYFDLAYANESLKLAKSYEEVSKAKYNQLDKSLQMGLANKMDSLEAKVRYDEAILGVSKAKREIEIKSLALSQFVGEIVGVKDSFENLNLTFFKNLDLKVYENVFQNLNYKQSAIATEISDKEKKKRMAGFLPTVDFNIEYSNSNYTDDYRFGDENHKTETTIRFSLPLFRSGLNLERLQEGELLKLSSMAKQANTQKKVDIEQKQAISDFNNYLQECEIMKQSLEHAIVYERAITQGYEEGLKDIVDLLDARARLYKTKSEGLNAGYKLINSYLTLESLVGNISIQTIKNLETAFNR